MFSKDFLRISKWLPRDCLRICLGDHSDFQTICIGRDMSGEMTGCLRSGHMTVCDSTINTPARLGLELLISERFVLQMQKTFNITENGADDEFYKNCKRLCNNTKLRAECSKNSHKLIDKYFSIGTAMNTILNNHEQV